MPKNKYVYYKVLNIPIYKGKFIVILGNDKRKIKKVYPNFNRETVYATTFYDRYKNDEGYYVVLNFDNKYNKITHGVIAHEALHCVNMLAEYRGFVPDFQNDEPLTYLLEWFVNEIHKFVKEKGFKVK